MRESRAPTRAKVRPGSARNLRAFRAWRIGDRRVTGFPFLVLLDGRGDVIARADGERSIEEVAAFANSTAGPG